MRRIAIKRVYDAPMRNDGRRILIDRLWPRGLKKDEAQIDEWIKDIAPSHELRKWFSHDAGKWPEFRFRYETELSSEKNQSILARLAQVSQSEQITLLFAAKDVEHNNAVVLAHLLRLANFKSD